MCNDILEAYIEGGIGVRSEGIAIWSYDVFGLAVFVSNRVLDLSSTISTSSLDSAITNEHT